MSFIHLLSDPLTEDPESIAVSEASSVCHRGGDMSVGQKSCMQNATLTQNVYHPSVAV